jgi:hypothetical protein
VCLTKSSPYGALGPYELRDSKGRIHENIWQFSKVYEKVPTTVQKAPYTGEVIWKRGEEIHLSYDERSPPTITKAYRKWRRDGMYNPGAVRYPVGKENVSRCLYALKHSPHSGSVIPKEKKLGIVEGRKKIYWRQYRKLVVRQPLFVELQQRLNEGENLLVIEVDGPQQQSLDYYVKKYGVPPTFIEDRSTRINKGSLKIFLNDTRHSFGHGFCLAAALLEIDVEDL